jgi:putative hemolysin
MSTETWEGVIFAVGVLLSAFFSGSEAALISIPAKRVKQLIEEGGARAKALQFLAEKPNEMLTTILVGNNFVNIFVASLATKISSRYFDSDALAYSVGITTMLILVFGEIIPKTFSRNHSEKLALPIIRILQVVYFSLFPIIASFQFIIALVLGKNAHLNDRVVTKDDIEFLVNEAEKEKTIDSKQIDLLNSILEFPTIKVRDIMVPRTQVNAFKHDATFEEVIEVVKDVAHSRYPVYEEDLDNVLGFLHVKDLSFVTDSEREGFKLESYIKEPFFVYEHMKIQAVFDHMNRKKVHLALVKDENGIVVGIVTLEDIMEEIFGEIHDEHDDEDDTSPTGEFDPIQGGLVVPATISLRDLYNEHDLKIPLNDNYSTLTGFILEQLGNTFPKTDMIVSWEGFTFKLTKVEDNEIEEVQISKTGGATKEKAPKDTFESSSDQDDVDFSNSSLVGK